MSTATESTDPGALPATWLAARWAVDPARVDGMRRDGQLIAVRRAGSPEWAYPSWQFQGGKPRPGIDRIVAAARERGIGDERLYELMTTPLGLGRSERRRLCDLLVEGRIDDVVAAIRASS